MKTLDFILGEKKAVEVEISSNDRSNTTFIIISAEYTLMLGKEEQLAGNATIDNTQKRVMFYLQPTKVGKQDLKITYVIGEEIYIDRLVVDVT